MEPEETARIIDTQVGKFGPYLDLPNFKNPPTELWHSQEFVEMLDKAKSLIDCLSPLYLGTDQQIYFRDLYQYPNTLIAGTIGSGKTQFIYNHIALWLSLKHPAEFKLLFCGSKPVDFNDFRRLDSHYLISANSGEPIISPTNFATNLESLLRECEKRLTLFALAGVKTWVAYNKKVINREIQDIENHRFLPEIVLVIDDLYNFASDERTVNLLIQLGQKNLYTGIYILAVTSQVNSRIISQRLLANFSMRIAFKVMSHNDSRKILEHDGAEKLRMPGYLLFEYGGKLVKTRHLFLEFDDLVNMNDYISGQRGYPSIMLLDSGIVYNRVEQSYDPNNLDPFFDESARLVVIHQQGSTSLIQRKLKLGYNRAGRVIDQLEKAGIVGCFEGSKARDVMFTDEYSLEIYLNKLHGISTVKNFIGSQSKTTETTAAEQPAFRKEDSEVPKTMKKMFNRFFGFGK